METRNLGPTCLAFAPDWNMNKKDSVIQEYTYLKDVMSAELHVVGATYPSAFHLGRDGFLHHLLCRVGSER